MSAPQLDVDADGDVQEQRRSLVKLADGVRVTLDGKPALLMGWALTNAVVTVVDDHGHTTDGNGHVLGELLVPWERVPYILEHGGAFAS